MSIIDKEEKIMQRTTNYGLCQYEGSDKTSYLVNYNDDMLKIDTAIKNAADAGSGAGTAAERAQGTADAAVEGVSTLNTQINGANGLAADVSTLQGSVGSINSLIGDGHPTTSNQTIIGAINGLEGAVAPREDGDNLANNYSIGEQFARGGSVFTALTPLTAGTPFASLVLNTNYKVSDTIVEQMTELSGDIADVENKFPTRNQVVSVTADGVKTLANLIAELNSALISAIQSLANSKYARIIYFSYDNYYSAPAAKVLYSNAVTSMNIWHNGSIASQSAITNVAGLFSQNPIYTKVILENGVVPTLTDELSSVPTSGKTYSVYYDII